MKKINGFTLVELLATIVIIGVVAIIVVPTVINNIEEARTKIYETRPRKKLILKSCPLVNSKNGTVCDVSAVLIADASDDDFVIKLAKYLTTLNGFPERF